LPLEIGGHLQVAAFTMAMTSRLMEGVEAEPTDATSHRSSTTSSRLLPSFRTPDVRAVVRFVGQQLLQPDGGRETNPVSMGRTREGPEPGLAQGLVERRIEHAMPVMRGSDALPIRQASFSGEPSRP
jgi:hypothetical protein